MEENNINEEITEEISQEISGSEQTEAPMTRRHYTKQQNIIYTIISIGLFFILYFVVKGIMGQVNRPYYIFVYADTAASGTADRAFEVSGISGEQGYVFESARFDRNAGGYELKIVFSGIEDEESFSENGMDFEYGDVEEDIRISFYPYEENPDYAEYVYADKYVNINDPVGEVYLFKWEGNLYAEYSERGTSMLYNMSELFSGQEKIYTDN